MKQKQFLNYVTKIIPIAISSLIVGLGVGLFVSENILPSFLDLESKRIVFATGLLGSLSSVFTVALLLLLDKNSPWTKNKYWYVHFGMIIIVLFAIIIQNFDFSQKSSKIIPLFLPKNSFELVVTPKEDEIKEIDSDTYLYWATRSIGDISWSSFDLNGWIRTDQGLKLIDRTNNYIRWSGRTGEGIKLYFTPVNPNDTFTINWNKTSILNTYEVEESTGLIIQEQFPMPFFTNRSLVFFVYLMSASILTYISFQAIAFGVLRIYRSNKLQLRFLNKWFHDQTNSIISSLHSLLLMLGTRVKFFGKTLSTFGDEGIRDEHQVASSKIGKRELIYTILVFFAALTLRVINLDDFPPYFDEYFHLLAAKNLLNHVPLKDVYQRGMYIVTIPAALSFKIFGIHFWAARLPGAIASAFAVIPLALICRRVHKHIGAIAVFLYATHPLITALGRNVREYAYQPLVFYLIALGMIYYISIIPTNFRLLKDLHILLRKKNIALLIALLTPIAFIIFVDRQSTLQLILPVYGIFGLFILGRLDFRDRPNIILLVVVLAGLGLIVYEYRFVFDNIHFSLSTLQTELKIFNSKSQQQWFFNKSSLVPNIALLISAIYAIRYLRKNYILLFVLLMSVVNIVVINGIFTERFRPRYMMPTTYWVIILMSIGLYALGFAIWRMWTKKHIFFLVSSIAVFSFINFSQILKPITFEGEWLKVSELRHYKLENVDLHIKKNMKPGDALIATVYDKYVKLFEEVEFAEIYVYQWSNPEPKKWLLSKMELHDSGWIVLDIDRGMKLSQPLKTQSMKINEFNLDYVGQFDSQFVWYWQKSLLLISPSNRLSHKEY